MGYRIKGFRVERSRTYSVGSAVFGLGFGAVWGLGFRVWEFRVRVWSLGFRV